jgi:hypothetical protein
MTADRAILIAGALVAAAIVAHALLTIPPHGGTGGTPAPLVRYQIVHLEADNGRVARLDTRTGVIVVCAGTPVMECGGP